MTEQIIPEKFLEKESLSKEGYKRINKITNDDRGSFERYAAKMDDIEADFSKNYKDVKKTKRKDFYMLEFKKKFLGPVGFKIVLSRSLRAVTVKVMSDHIGLIELLIDTLRSE